MIPVGFPIDTEPIVIPPDDIPWYVPILSVIPIRAPPEYVKGKRTRELIGLAMLCALVLANEREGDWHTAYLVFLHSLQSILPKHTQSDRQTIARKWLLRYT